MAGNHERIKGMLSAYLDNELTQADSQQVRVHLEDCEHCRETLRQLRELQRVTGELTFVEPEEERMEQVKEKLSVQAPRKAGWSFFLAGVVGWVIYAIHLFVTDPEVPPIEKLVIAAVYIGLFLLFLSVARQRWFELPHDRYRGVKK